MGLLFNMHSSLVYMGPAEIKWIRLFKPCIIHSLWTSERLFPAVRLVLFIFFRLSVPLSVHCSSRLAGRGSLHFL